MLEPDTVFAVGNLIALAGWAALAAALFVERWRATGLMLGGRIIPIIMALAYVPLIASGFGEASGGGFGSINEVRALFGSDAALTAGWFHFLAFDLFVGAWIARTGLAERMAAPLLLPCLAATFFAGPVGLLLFTALRSIPRRAESREMPS